jgi:hypothetical protein
MRSTVSRCLLAACIAALTACSEGQTPTSTSAPVLTTPPTTPEPTQASTPSPTPSAEPVDPLSPRPGLETAPPAGQPVCVGSTLTVTDADTIVTPTHKREVFVIRTTGRACQLRGYPTVRLIGPDGRQLQVTVQRGGYGLPREREATYTIDRGTSLSFEVGTARDGVCRDVATASVVLPQTTKTHRVPTTLRVCGSTVGVSPVHRAVDDE